jgi:DNA-binding LacI/PurR family transcriptional regulator
VPNALARSLVTQSTCTIGIVASDLSDTVLARFVVGAEREARRRGHGVLTGASTGRPPTPNATCACFWSGVWTAS